MKFLVVLLGLVCALAHGAPKEEVIKTPHPAYVKDIERLPNSNSRIINGQNAARDQFPYQVSIEWGFILSGSHICGGSIVSKTTVLTAAHCIMSYGTHSITAGILNRGETTASREIRSVSSIVAHENWPGGNNVAPFDIAVMKVDTPFTLTSSVQIVPLSSSSDLVTSGAAVVSGWGTTVSTGTSVPTTLQYANQAVITNTQCALDLTSVMGTSNPLDDTMICTSGRQGVVVCSGDSGGPLVQNGVQIGIVSWGISPCGTTIAPSVYTRVSSYATWIFDHL